MDERAIASLQELGLSLYEARLYVGLLANGSQNGNELSRTSAVPSSKVYSTLDKLAAAGIVQQRQRGTSAEYVCVPPVELVRRLRVKYARPLEYLEEALPKLRGADADTEPLHIVGEQTVIDQARDLIGRAESDLYLSAWDENIDSLRDALADADSRGVHIFGMIYGEAELGHGSWLHHSYRDTVASRIGGHMLTIVMDGRTALIAHSPKSGEASGVVTTNPVLCLVAEEYLRHDLILQKAKTMTGYEEWDRWLHADANVRDLTLGRTGHESPIASKARTRRAPRS